MTRTREFDGYSFSHAIGGLSKSGAQREAKEQRDLNRKARVTRSARDNTYDVWVRSKRR